MSDPNVDNPLTPPKKIKLSYKQKYCIEWEAVASFKGWLSASKKGNILKMYFFYTYLYILIKYLLRHSLLIFF